MIACSDLLVYFNQSWFWNIFGYPENIDETTLWQSGFMRTRSHFCQIMLLIWVSPAEVPCQIPPPRQILPWGSSSLCAALGNGGETTGPKWVIEKYSPGSSERLASACMTKKLEPSKLSLDIGCLTRSSFPCGSTIEEPANCLELSLDPSSYGQMIFFYWDFIIEPSALALPSTIVIVLLLLLSPFFVVSSTSSLLFSRF